MRGTRRDEGQSPTTSRACGERECRLAADTPKAAHSRSLDEALEGTGAGEELQRAEGDEDEAEGTRRVGMTGAARKADDGLGSSPSGRAARREARGRGPRAAAAVRAG